MSVKKLLGAAAWKGLLLAVVTLLLLLAAAALMLQRGLVGESAASALAVCLYAVVWLVAIGGETDFAAHGPLLTGAIFGGAVLAGLPGRKKGKRQAGTRRAGERPRRATAHGRR